MTTSSRSTTTFPWRRSLDDALAEARSAKRPVLLDFFNPT
jgi:hypothetical protein